MLSVRPCKIELNFTQHCSQNIDTQDYGSQICAIFGHLSGDYSCLITILQLEHFKGLAKNDLPGALCGRRCRGEGQTGLHHHVMKGEESPQDDVSPFLQHRQGYRTWDYFALLTLGLVGVVGKNHTP